jgi:hypothetical protein
MSKCLIQYLFPNSVTTLCPPSVTFCLWPNPRNWTPATPLDLTIFPSLATVLPRFYPSPFCDVWALMLCTCMRTHTRAARYWTKILLRCLEFSIMLEKRMNHCILIDPFCAPLVLCTGRGIQNWVLVWLCMAFGFGFALLFRALWWRIKWGNKWVMLPFVVATIARHSWLSTCFWSRLSFL